MGIFKAYDIRGVYPHEINEDIAYKIGRGFVVKFKVRQVLVGMDMRTSSPSIYKALAKGITEQGANVIFGGMMDTPMFYFCCKKYESGIMVTASHNPGKYNGMKAVTKNVMPVTFDSGFKAIGEMVERGKFPSSRKKGKILQKDFRKEFIDFNLKFAKGIRPMKVAIDAANGMGGFTFPLVFGKLKKSIDYKIIFPKPDGNFPNHEPNPLKPENMEWLRKLVLKEKADIGIAPDGDADRCMFMDEKGGTVPGDIITALVAQDVLKKHKGSPILFDVRASRIVPETVKANGGKPIMWRVGHSYIKEKMRKEDCFFAGEVSAHFYWKDNMYAESSLLTAFAIMRMVSSTGKKLSQLVAPLKKYFKTDEINFEVHDKQAKMDELARIFRDGKINRMDGIRIDYKDWWFNVRGSNTEPLLRLNLEANTKEKMLEMQEKISRIISK